MRWTGQCIVSTAFGQARDADVGAAISPVTPVLSLSGQLHHSNMDNCTPSLPDSCEAHPLYAILLLPASVFDPRFSVLLHFWSSVLSYICRFVLQFHAADSTKPRNEWLGVAACW